MSLEWLGTLKSNRRNHMKTLKVLKFAYRHSFRSGRFDFLAAFKMGLQVYA